MRFHDHEKLVKEISTKWWHGTYDYYVLRTLPYDGRVTKHYVKKKYIKIAEQIFGDVPFSEVEPLNYFQGKNWKP